ncbi:MULTISPECIES: hypothetical protein [Paraburkholderia]|uniref:Uncharacterized protein n=1 Tax=Paraburkholderia podalyriae TaxID=1938811 RepID=A0ABR7PFF2_9BURK|nr:hypothetical protein [Paraburkholderia podalyriae]MBC8745108.1 hypothetical protein [Paraburkholderia podalyriae]
MKDDRLNGALSARRAEIEAEQLSLDELLDMCAGLSVLMDELERVAGDAVHKVTVLRDALRLAGQEHDEAIEANGTMLSRIAIEALKATERLRDAQTEARRATARKAADSRHTETRAIKADVFAWCEENLGGKSIDSAAEAIAGKHFPIKFTTARKYISEYRKSMQSARTA